MDKGAAADAYISPAYGTDAAFGLVGYLCRGGMVAMPLLHRQLACKADPAALGKRLGVGADFARNGSQWRARKPQRSAAAGEHRTGEHPAQRTIDAHAAQQTFGRVQGCSTPCTLALRRERSSKRQRLLVKAAGREERALCWHRHPG